MHAVIETNISDFAEKNSLTMSTLPDRHLLNPILVGREQCLEVLQQHLEEARKGHGHILLMAGEAGIGKSRLVTEAIVWGRQNSMEVLRGNCSEPGRMLPFGNIHIPYSLVFDMPVKTSLELMTSVGWDRAYPEGKLFENVVY